MQQNQSNGRASCFKKSNAMMRSILVSGILMMLMCGAALAQVPKSFPVDDDAAFIDAFGKYIASNNRPEAKELGIWLQKSFLLRPTTPDEMTAIKATANLMLSKRVPLWPNFYNYSRLMMQVQTTEVEADIVAKNFIVLQGLLQSAHPESIKQFNAYVDYLNEHYKDKSLYRDKAKQWSMDAPYTLEAEEGMPVMVFAPGALLGTTSADTMMIQETSGKFYPLTGEWEGPRGKISWRRAGFPEDKVYADFNAYRINLIKPELSVDSVLFTFQPYADARLRGSFKDILTNSKAVASTFPQFTSFDKVPFKGLSEDLKFDSGLSLEGTKLYATGTARDNAELTIRGNKGQNIVQVKAKRFLISNFKQVDAENASIAFYLLGDKRPLIHPALTFSYNIERRQVKATREDKPDAKIPMMSEFFMMNFYVDQVVWNIDSNYADLNSISVNAQVPSIFESYNYYIEGIENKYKQFLDFDPLDAIVKTAKSYNSRVLHADDVAAVLRAKDVKTVESLLFKMMEDGYLHYDRTMGLVTVFDKMVLHNNAVKEDLDYDNLRFASNTRGKVGKILLDKQVAEIYGVQKMSMSKSRNMIVTPKSDTIYIGENRGITVKGILTAGKVNFYANNLKFNYENFVFNMDNIDSMLVMVPTGEVDKYGNVYLMEINTPIQSISGTLYIDAPNNRSGKRRYLEYPYFVCNDSSYVYFDKGKKGALFPQEDFYFLVYPFVFDSMSTFETEALNFPGEFVSAGIFPTFKSQLSIQEDLTLGFNTDTPEDGLDLYRGKGNFSGNIVLDAQGIHAKGVIRKKSLHFEIEKGDFFPDSLYAAATKWYGLEDQKANLPTISAASAEMYWAIPLDSLSIIPTEQEAQVMAYGQQAAFLGTYKVVQDQLLATGTMDVGEGHFSSDRMHLKAEKVATAPVNFQLKAQQQDVFSAKQVSAGVDFKQKKAFFSVADTADLAKISSNLLSTNIKKYEWDFDNRQLVFRSNASLGKEYFEFDANLLKGIRFSADVSTLDIEAKTLSSSGVSQILVADSKVIPEKNELVVTADGTFSQFRNAVVVFNADSSHHVIENATVDVLNVNKMNGFGTLRFKSGQAEKFIRVEDFSTSEIKIEPEKSKGKQGPETRYYVKARGLIPEEEKYQLADKITYKGDVLFSSLSKELTLDGFAKLDLQSEPLTEWFKITQSIDFQRAYFGIDSLKNEFKQLVYTGLMLDMNEFNLYPRLIQSKEYGQDRPIYKAAGVMKDLSGGAFAFGSESTIAQPKPYAEMMRYDDNSGQMDIYGQFGLLDNIEPAQLKVFGSANFNKKDTSLFTIQGTAAFDFYLLPEINSHLHRMILDYNASAPALQLINNKNYSNAMRGLIRKVSDAEAIANDMERFNVLNVPLDFPYNIVFSDLKLMYDPEDGTFKSVNPAALLVFGGKPVQQRILAYVEIGPRAGKDFINLYLQTTSGDWFYLRYVGGDLGIITSDERFNTFLGAIKPDRRMLKSGKDKIYEFMPASVALKNNFVARIEDFRMRILNP
jgi:hypothetical protein